MIRVNIIKDRKEVIEVKHYNDDDYDNAMAWARQRIKGDKTLVATLYDCEDEQSPSYDFLGIAVN